MKLHYKYFCFIASLFSLFCVSKDIQIKVLLDEKKHHGHNEWIISAARGMHLTDNTKARKKVQFSGKQLSITFRHGHFYVNKRKWKKKKIIIEPIHDHLSFQEKHYEGSFILLKHDRKIMLINSLNIEKYVCSVLKTESWPGWPLEVNKAFAITSRTYVISMMLDAQKSDRPYHVKNSNFHQTYQGVHDRPVLKKAVEQTEGVFLGHDNKPILAMYDSCCGGIIPAHIEDFDFEKAPYLQRQYACDFCKTCKIYSWEKEMLFHEFENCIKEKIVHLKRLRKVQISKYDKAGIVKEINLKGYPKSVTLTGKKFYSLLKEVKSFCFSIEKRGRKILINGRGYGHHIGLCQWGARQMVRDGWNYKSILHFYYPGTVFMKII